MSTAKSPAGDITVAILAGGQSSRMGRDKAGVELDGQTLGERAADLALTMSDDVVVLGHGRGMPEALARIDDRAPDRGPLGGLCALAARTNHQRILVVPVDMPALTAPLLRTLVDALEGGAVDVAHFDGSPLPCALLATALGRLPDHGSLQAAFASLRARALRAPDPEALENVNTSDDLHRSSRRPPFR